MTAGRRECWVTWDRQGRPLNVWPGEPPPAVIDRDRCRMVEVLPPAFEPDLVEAVTRALSVLTRVATELSTKGAYYRLRDDAERALEVFGQIPGLVEACSQEKSGR